MLKTWMKTTKEEIATVQEEMGATRDLLVAREQGCLLVISAHWISLIVHLVVQVYYFCVIIFYVSFTLAGFFLLQMTWRRMEGAWRSWMAQRRMDGLQRRLVEEEEELDVCSICLAEYAGGDEVSPNPSFELR